MLDFSAHKELRMFFRRKLENPGSSVLQDSLDFTTHSSVIIHTSLMKEIGVAESAVNVLCAIVAFQNQSQCTKDYLPFEIVFYILYLDIITE